MGDKTEEPWDWVICGRLIGKATGWDQADTFVITIYGLQPAPSYKGPVADCINVSFERGMIETYDEGGNVKESADLIDAVKDCAIDRID